MGPLIALEQILVKAIPTFILVWILYFYATRVFLRPLQQVLQKRHESTEGLRKMAEARIATAGQKASEYQENLRASSAELYRQQEQERQKSLEQRMEILRQARQRAGEKLARARQEIQQDTQEAQKVLSAQSEQMARWITQAILEPAQAAPPSGSPGGSEVSR